jgi:hypothetical protein
VVEGEIEPDRVECVGDALPDLVARYTEVFTTERNVVPHPSEDDLAVGVLQYEAGTPSTLAWRRSVEEKLAIGFAFIIPAEYAGERVQQGRFASTRGTK